MKSSIPIVLIMMGALFGGGCATRKYVRRQVAPVSGKPGQVATKADQQGQTLDEVRADYNSALSLRRADAVMEYLVAQHDIPIKTVHSS